MWKVGWHICQPNACQLSGTFQKNHLGVGIFTKKLFEGVTVFQQTEWKISHPQPLVA